MRRRRKILALFLQLFGHFCVEKEFKANQHVQEVLGSTPGCCKDKTKRNATAENVGNLKFVIRVQIPRVRVLFARHTVNLKQQVEEGCTERLGIKVKSATVGLANAMEFAVLNHAENVEALRAGAANALKEKITRIITAVGGLVENDRGQTALSLQQAQHQRVEVVKVGVAKGSFCQKCFKSLPRMAVVGNLLRGDTVLRGYGCE